MSADRSVGDSELTASSPGDSRAGPDAARAGEQPGDTIGPYRILEVVGEGGFGIVYVAEQRHPVRRRVALKVVKAGMDSKEVIARFEAERQALAIMDHPNVAKVFDAGMTPTGRPFFAMEHVPGLPITDYCDTAKLRTRDRIELFIQVCQAVQHAHQKGIVHRDLKPSNILVTLFDGKPVPKVIDFGIAKALHGPLTQRTLYTETGRLMGTPEYMSPEQAITSGLDVDTRTDIYSLGVILYQLLTGTLPFDPLTLRKAGSEGIARIIREMEPPKPSTRLSTLISDPAARGGAETPADFHRTRGADARTLISELRGDLDWITLKAMEKERSRRYETANALGMDLKRYLANEPVAARPPSVVYRTRKFVRRYRAVVTATLLVVLSLSFGLSAAVYQWVRTAQTRDDLSIALSEAQRARDAEKLQRQAADEARRAADEQRAVAEIARADAEFNSYVSTLVAAQAELRDFDSAGAATRLDSVPEAQRGFEWNHLRADCDSTAAEPLALGEKGQSYTTVLSPDGSLAALWADPATEAPADAERAGPEITVRNTRTGQVVRVLPYPAVPLFRIKFSPDNRYLFAYALLGEASRLWDLRTGQQILPEHLQKGTALMGFDHEATRVVVAFRVGYLVEGVKSPQESTRVLKLGTWEEVSTLRDPTGATWSQSAVFSRDGSRVALCQGTGEPFGVFDAATGELLKQLDTGWVFTAAFSADGKYLAAGFADYGRAVPRVWETDTWKETSALKGEGIDASQRLEFVEQGGATHLLTLGGRRSALQWWSINSGQEEATWRVGDERLGDFGISPDRWITTVSMTGVVRRVDLTRPISTSIPTMYRLELSPDGSTLAIGGTGTLSRPDTVHFLRLTDMADVGRLCCTPAAWGQTHAASALAYDPTGENLLAFHGVNGQPTTKIKRFSVGARRWETPPGLPPGELHNNVTVDAAYSPDGRFYASCDLDGTVALWGAQTFQRVAVLTGHEKGVMAIAFSPDGARLASASIDTTVKVWSLESFKEVRTLRAHEKDVRDVEFLADGARIVSVSMDGTARLWNALTGECERVLERRSEPLLSCALNRTGTRLAIGGASSIHLWDTSSWRRVVTFRASAPVLSLTFTPDDRAIIGQHVDGTISVLDASPESERSPARRALYDAEREARPIVDRLLASGNDHAACRDRVEKDASIAPVVRGAAVQIIDRLAGLDMQSRFAVGNHLANQALVRVMLSRAEVTADGVLNASGVEAALIAELKKDGDAAPIELETALDTVKLRIAKLVEDSKSSPLYYSDDVTWDVLCWHDRAPKWVGAAARTARAMVPHASLFPSGPEGVLTDLLAAQVRTGDAAGAQATTQAINEAIAKRSKPVFRPDIESMVIIAEAMVDKQKASDHLDRLLAGFSLMENASPAFLEAVGGALVEGSFSVGGTQRVMNTLERLQARLGALSYVTLGCLFNGVTYLLWQGELETAQGLVERCEQLVRADLSTHDGYSASAVAARVQLLCQQKRFAEAEPLARRTVELRERASATAPMSRLLGAAQARLGAILAAQGKDAEAERYLCGGFRRLTLATDFAYSTTREAGEALVRLYEKQGHMDKADRIRAILNDLATP